MKIPLTLQPILDTPRRELSSLLKQLQVGQILQAKVLAQVQPSIVRLRMAATELLARTPLPLETGARLKLEVVRNQDLPELRIIRSADPQPARSRAVRSALSRQMPPAEMRQTVSELRVAATDPKQADAIRRFETIVRDASVEPHKLTASQLKRALSNSGIFHETRLLNVAPPTQADMKFRLLQLLGMLEQRNNSPRPAGTGREQPTPQAGEQSASRANGGNDPLLGRLMRLVEGTVARIQLQQASALPAEDGTRQVWQVDLPVRLPDGDDDVVLRIERDDEGSGDGSDGASWSINLAFDFDTIGKLSCRIGLNGERVATSFWCTNPTTHTRLEQRLPTLQHALEAQGLDVAHLSGTLGDAPTKIPPLPATETLLDERA